MMLCHRHSPFGIGANSTVVGAGSPRVDLLDLVRIPAYKSLPKA